MLSGNNLFKKFKTGEVVNHVLKGIDIQINHTEFLTITGPSGSGKSTLLNLLAVLDTPTSGDVIYKNQNYLKQSESHLAQIRNKNFGIVFQSYQLFPNLTAKENTAAPAYINSEVSDPNNQAIRLLDTVGLKDHIDKYPDQLSGGQKQRVAIARALVNEPDIIFADEPTGNLDSITGGQILELFQKLNKEEGITFVIVTHDKQISQKAKRVIYLADGYIQDDTHN
jgi:putative ABC transport system ATP-binding protein